MGLFKKKQIEIDKKQVRKDLIRWAKELRKVDAIVRALYLEFDDLYGNVTESKTESKDEQEVT